MHTNNKYQYGLWIINITKLNRQIEILNDLFIEICVTINITTNQGYQKIQLLLMYCIYQKKWFVMFAE